MRRYTMLLLFLCFGKSSVSTQHNKTQSVIATTVRPQQPLSSTTTKTTTPTTTTTTTEASPINFRPKFGRRPRREMETHMLVVLPWLLIVACLGKRPVKIYRVLRKIWPKKSLHPLYGLYDGRQDNDDRRS